MNEDDDEKYLNDADDLTENSLWNGVEQLVHYEKLGLLQWKAQFNGKCNLFGKVNCATSQQKNLLKMLLMMNPKKRIQSQRAMEHEYFQVLQDKSLLLFPNKQCQYI